MLFILDLASIFKCRSIRNSLICLRCYFSKHGFCQKFSVLSDFSICVAYSQGESKGEMGHEDLFLSGDISQWRKVISSGFLLFCRNMTFDKRSWNTPTHTIHCIFSLKHFKMNHSPSFWIDKVYLFKRSRGACFTCCLLEFCRFRR